MNTSFSFTAHLWLWSGKAGWYFITLPKEAAAEIKFFFSQTMTGQRRGFGSVRVAVTIGNTSWKTSIFPDTNSGSYVLPIKASVRRAENITADDEVDLIVRVISDSL